MEKNNTRRGNTPKEKAVITNKVILNLIQDLQRLLLQLIKNMRGRCQIKFGMTSLCNNGGRRGFTLIELLVVVLIIGILAAVALPQYQKAVEKSRAAEAFTVLKLIRQAQQIYYLTHSSYPTSFEELDIDLSDTGETMNTPTSLCCIGDEKLTKVISPAWAISIDSHGAYATRLQGKYANKAGFMLWESNPLKCFGSEEYCENIFKGTYQSSSGPTKFYSIN